MKVTIEITKKYFFIICAIIVLCSGVIVYAYNPSGVGANPAVMGHTWNEMNCDSNLCVKDGKIGIGTTTPYGGVHLKALNPEIWIDGDGGTNSVFSMLTGNFVATWYSLQSNGHGSLVTRSLDKFEIFDSAQPLVKTLVLDFVNQRVGVYHGNPQYTLDVGGSLQADDYYSGAGLKGNTTTIYLEDRYGENCKLIIQDGLVVGNENCDLIP